MIRSIIPLLGLVLFVVSSALAAEEIPSRFYAAPFGGLVFPHDITDAEGRGPAAGISYSDLSLKSSAMLGIKLGFAPAPKSTWVNWELELFYSSPHLKQQPVKASAGGVSVQGEISGAHVRHLVGAFNFVLRYPYGPIQPYAGVGPSVNFIRGSSQELGTSHDTALGLNLLVGTRVAVTDTIAGFLEYKHNRSSFDFAGLAGDANISALVAGAVFSF